MFESVHRLATPIDYHLEAAMVAPEDAAALAVPTGFAVLAVVSTAFAPDGARLITGRTISRSDRFAYEFCARPELHSRRR